MLVLAAALVGLWHLQPPVPQSAPSPSRAPPAGGGLLSKAPGRTPGTPGSETRATGGSAPGTLRVGAWNIEWLGRPDSRSGVARGVEQRPEDLADYLIASGVAVLGVEEIIASGGSNPIRSRILEETLAMVGRTTGDRWEYVLYPGRKRGDQLTGVLWNTRFVEALDSEDDAWAQGDTPWRLPVSGRESSQGSVLWSRPPHAMKFSAGEDRTDFVVIVLHMKADYDGDFASHRGEEGAELAGLLPGVSRAFDDADLVLIGDANLGAGDEPAARALRDAGLGEGPSAGAGFISLNTGGLPTHVKYGALDAAFVPASQPEFVRDFEVISGPYLDERNLSAAEFKAKFSDHFMVVTTIRVRTDDD